MESGSFLSWSQYFSQRGISFETLPADALSDGNITIPIQLESRLLTSYILMQWLMPRQDLFHLVVLHDWLGAGYFALVRLGVFINPMLRH